MVEEGEEENLGKLEPNLGGSSQILSIGMDAQNPSYNDWEFKRENLEYNINNLMYQTKFLVGKREIQ